MDGMRLRNSKVLPPRKEEGGGDADRISVRSGGSTRTSSSKSSVLSKIEMLRAIDKQQEEARARLRAQEDSMQELREKLLLDLKTGSRSSRASRKSETSRSEDDRLKLKTMTVCSFLSVWFIVAFTVERFVAVRYPLKRPSMCTVTRAKLVLVCLSLGASVGYMPYIFISEVAHSDMNGTNVSICGAQEDQMDVVTTLNHIDTVVNLVVPFVTIIVLNTMIARTVCRVARVRRRMTKGATSNHPSRGARTASSQTKVTEMLLVVSTVFITLNLPYYMLRLWLYVTDGYKPMEEQDQNVIAIQQFFYVLLQTNFGINFGLYCVSGQNFRRALLSLFRPEYSRRGVDASQVTVVSEYCRTASTRRTFTVNGSWREAHELVSINRMRSMRSDY
ncbi:hypothetical protein GE061_004024 [Apolygus lucorum]|uniref:G-protein coupled receptors family 1 profile domain-containing protein n=1 Tax=Apolygus lucorum TaxID=248454 RepID=A0A8S9WZV5_APOLU|nr:hypothetical protein GE061_004024 [Apolygus lucorum]